MKRLDEKLNQLPKEPGVYLFKDGDSNIIYIGKAAILKNRVRQYFQKSRPFDAKTESLVKDIKDIEWITVDSEIDALFLEAELVRRYLPRYNILLRDDKSTAYVRINSKSKHPTVTMTRRPLDDGAEYFGPYFAAGTVRRALHFLRRAFPYSTHVRTIPKRVCLQYHLGLCPGLEENKTSLQDYRKNLVRLKQYLRGERKKLMRGIEKEMQSAATVGQFEKAAQLRNQLFALKALSKQIIFSDKEFLDISKDEGLRDLAELIGLYDDKSVISQLDGVQGSQENRVNRINDTKNETRSQLTQQSAESFASVSNPVREQGKALRLLRRIEGYDISHMSGTDTVASMVVFINGLPAKTDYRKFKMRLPGNDDFAHMREVMKRRFSQSNVKKWKLADLILIDGGKGQVSSALEAMRELGFDIPMIGLAKRHEEIVVPRENGFEIVRLPKNSNIVKLLQRIRDESHRFAVSYHSVLKRERQTNNILEDIPGIGPTTRKKLLRHFGSVKNISAAPKSAIAEVIGQSKASIVCLHLKESADV